MGQRLCQRCKTPLTYRYLWAIGNGIEKIAPGTVVGDRYRVIAPQIWLDTRPNRPPEAPEEIPENLLAYLKLFAYRLHTPTIYSFTVWESTGVLLLENAPIDSSGKLFPAIASLLPTATAVRQVYWLWQLLDLWVPLKELGVATSLLIPDNIRIEGWRVRLRALYLDNEETAPPQLGDLAALWQSWATGYRETIQQPLQQISEAMQAVEINAPPEKIQAIALQLNQLLLERAATLPLRLNIASATSTGPRRSLNEDYCYPHPNARSSSESDALASHLAIVCDGVGGHAGGEVASQMAVRSLQIQLRALLNEISEQTELSSPQVVAEQLEALIRIANNLIANQNDEQEREARDRMGTTLVMALQLPQMLQTEDGQGNSHELYLGHLGDSRAYWITPRYCHLLTVDDDVAVREVRNGRNLHREALRRMDGGVLTQAVGTRVGDYIYPTLQRFILEEDGVLLLCSDGLSDKDRVEQYWETVFQPLFKDRATLDEIAQRWVDLANEKSGHDNVSVVLMHCQVTPEQPRLFDPSRVVAEEKTAEPTETELSESARALLYDTAEAPRQAEIPKTPTPGKSNYWMQVLTLLLAMLVVGVGSTIVWQLLSPESFNRFWQRYPAPEETTPEQ
ncbi:protein phosphatase 2C domain-containing protein [Leptolyngbya sp. FACHB-16]|nr:protein phosphatase 2C domain-containing protein [Leptolyngbya sp. FACHB-8]MBD2157830.1 protein phosphatase 2C domain-containing protein [Leptolyngbya sp. FACHB-16]